MLYKLTWLLNSLLYVLLQDLTCFWLSMITLKYTGQEKKKSRKLKFREGMRKKYAAGSNVYCKCLSRDPLNFPSFGPLCFQTFHTFPCRHSFVCHSCWPRSDTVFSMSNLLPIMFLYSKPTEQPQKHGVRKCTLCVCMTT